MDDMAPFASRDYLLLLLLLVFARGMDFLSTWIATPNLVLEGNPLAKKLGWKWGLLLNVALVGVLAMWPLSAIVVATASVLVAARNFQSAWLMHSLGEENYRRWHVERIQETRITLYLLCLAGNTLLTAGVGAALICSSHLRLAPFAIGMGMVAYAIAVAFYTLLAIWRIRRMAKKREARQNNHANGKALAAEPWTRVENRVPDKII
jgi:membrane protein implicated in regulation of membrane protease activity